MRSVVNGGGWIHFRREPLGLANAESDELINIFDTIGIPIVVLGSGFAIACFNLTAAEVLGLAPSDLGRPPRDISALAGLPDLQEWCADVLATGVPCRRDFRYINKSFVLRIAHYTSSDRQFEGTVLTFNDVTAFRASIDQAIYEREFTKVILNAVADPLIILDADLRVQSGNLAFFATFGVSRDEMQGRSVYEFGDRLLDCPQLHTRMQGIANGRTFDPFEIEREFPDRGLRALRLDARQLSLPGHSGRLFLLALYDITEHKHSEAATARLASIVESSDDAIISKDLNGVITSWNRGAERLFGYVAAEIVGKPITLLIPPDRYEEENKIIDRIRRGQSVEPYETILKSKQGDLIEISLTVSPLKEAQGKVTGASTIVRDITTRKRHEEQIVMLAREAEHRAKNILATVQATVHLAQSDTVAGLKHAIEGRLQALANVHRLFVQSRWAGADLYSLTAQELSPYCQDGETRARINGASLLLEPNAAQTIAVTLHELATNAAKYGALSVPAGKVLVDWSHAADKRLVLRWTETGGPLVKPSKHRGFGMRVMESMIRQLNGAMRFNWHPEGVACEIVLSIANEHDPERELAARIGINV
jgi:PAS domain S-box-containing protein